MEPPVSRHPTLPPIMTTLEPAPLRETRRKRSTGGVWAKRATDATDETEDASESARPASSRSATSANGTPIEAVERRVPSISGKLSDDTLKTMLELQEASGEQTGSTMPTTES